MTNFTTETEAESYEAADLARIALQAAIDAIDAYQARNGVCDAPFRVSISVDNGNEADREVSGPEIELTRLSPEDARRFADSLDNPAEPNEALRRAAAAHDRYTGRDGWIRHDGTGMPRNLGDGSMIEWFSKRQDKNMGVRDAAIHNWFKEGYYRVREDA